MEGNNSSSNSTFNQQQQQQKKTHVIDGANKPTMKGSSTQRVKTSSGVAAAVEAGDKVRLVTVAEYKQAALCLAEAFADDDVALYAIDTPDRAHWTSAQKWDLHVSILEYITYAHILKGQVFTVGANYGCVALWMPPGKNMDDYMTLLRSGLWRLWYKLSPEGKTRFFDEFFPLLHDTKHEVMGPRDNDSYYLVYIGTKPSARGKGLCRKSIEFVTNRADAEGRACYLESSNAINPIIYRKLGFETVRKIYLKRRVDKEVEMEIMVREPRACETGSSSPASLEKVDSLFSNASGFHQVSVSMKIGGDKEAVARVALV